MCTALSIKSNENKHFFGRNMDLAYNFNQSILIIPRNYNFKDIVTGDTITNGNAIIGMGTIIDNHAVLADGMNEKGLACAGLNFARYSHYEENETPGKKNIPPYDFIHWVLSNHETVTEVKATIKNIELIARPINKNTPLPTLHWMIADKTGKSIVVEKTKTSFAVYDNPVGVMTNNPTFDWHLTNLNEYITITPNFPKETNWSDLTLKPLGVGIGGRGIPGDYGSASRFVRIAYLRSHMTALENDVAAISQFFNMLDYVKMVKGGAITNDNLEDLTLYSSCMNQEKGIYYYKTYNNNRINAVDMNKEDLDASEVKIFPYLDTQDINMIN
ncbi:MAG: choloylglycine hydrolase [Clostridium sp.]